jgi:hypothetical protein
VSRPPSEPGWYWANWVLGSTGRTEWRPVRVARLNSGDLVVPDGAWLIDQHEWGPRILPPTEPPAPSLEDDVRAATELLLSCVDDRRADYEWDERVRHHTVRRAISILEAIRARLGAGGGHG